MIVDTLVDVTIMPQRTVRISEPMVRAIKKFLDTAEAKERGFDSIADVTTAAVRDLLEKYGYYDRQLAYTSAEEPSRV